MHHDADIRDHSKYSVKFFEKGKYQILHFFEHIHINDYIH